MLGDLAFFGLVAAVLTAVWRFVSPRLKVAKLTERFVVITGCDSGFGRAAALRLQSRGLKVIATCLTPSGLKSLQDEAARNGPGSVQCVLLDLTKADDVDKAVAAIKAIVGERPLHALLNNSGVLKGGMVDAMPISDWQVQLDVNVLGIARMTKPLIPLLFRGDGESRIINVASVAGVFATEGTCSYNASKFAVVGVTDALHRELRPWGIQVAMILPGIMKTELWRAPLSAESQQRSFDSLSPEQKAFYGGPSFFARAFDEARSLVDLVAGDPERVVDAMEELCTCKFVATRRYVGHDTWAFRLLAALPDVVSDALWAARHHALKTKPVLPKAVEDRQQK